MPTQPQLLFYYLGAFMLIEVKVFLNVRVPLSVPTEIYLNQIETAAFLEETGVTNADHPPAELGIQLSIPLLVPTGD